MTIYIVEKTIEFIFEADEVEIVFVSTSKADVEKFKNSQVSNTNCHYYVQVWRDGVRQCNEEW